MLSVAELLIVGATAFSAPGAALRPSDDVAALPGVRHGWNTSVGSESDHRAAAAYFGVNVSDDESLWTNNSMCPFFVGNTLLMTDIKIIERNAFNTLIELAVKTGNVLWTVQPGPSAACGPWVEHINGAYTGVSHTAGHVSRGAWLEQDNKQILGHTVANDWGMVALLPHWGCNQDST